MYNILIDELPTAVRIGGEPTPVRFDAKTLIAISVLVEENPSSMLDEKQQAQLAIRQLQLFYPTPPSPRHFEEAMQRLVEFFMAGKEQKAKPEAPQRARFDIQSNRRNFSFNHDQNMIVSAFWQQYGVSDVGKLHWFQFKALLDGLTEDCLFIKIIQFRTMKIHNKMSKVEKEYYRKMKRIYALPDNRPQEVKDREFAMALMYL